jgi:hypothetical protein
MRCTVFLIAACLLGCNDRTQGEDCYKIDPAPGATFGPYLLVCGHPFGYLPETPEGLGLEEKGGPYHVALCEAAASSAECSMCTTDNVNERIVAHILEEMAAAGSLCDPVQVDHIIPECVTTPEQGSNTGCCFNAWYGGSCNIKESP